MWSATGAVLWTAIVIMVESRTSLDINPGLAVAIRNYGRPAEHTPFLLHPSLTSAKYLEAEASSRRAKQTNFNKLKEDLLDQEGKSF